jgi:hypothetical protein
VFCSALAALSVVIASGSWATDEPIIQVSREALNPPRLEVHVGEVVRWRTAPGERLRIQLDDHPMAHGVIMRSGEIRAVFLKPGEHWYTGSIVYNGQKPFRGLVVVRNPDSPPHLPPLCSGESSDRICFMP